MRPIRRLALPVLGVLTAAAVGACAGAAQAPSWTFPPVASPGPVAGAGAQAPAEAATSPAPVAGTLSSTGGAGQPANAAPVTAAAGIVTHLDLTIVTGDMIGHTEFPAYVPSDFTLPANSTVVITVTNFDNATPLPKGSEQYADVTGTVGGTMTTTPIVAAYPNRVGGPAATLSKLDPNAVSHTFTIAALGINVPIPAMSRTTFTIHTGAPGTFSWRCMDPCGAGATGWGTAMSAKQGFMEGTLTVV